MKQVSDPQINHLLNRLHREASSQKLVMMKGLARSAFRKLQPEDMRKAYLAISPDQGRFLYDLLIQRKAKHIVEFGTSFGISTIYLAAAARANGGKVITSELLPEKCAIARQNFELANLSNLIDHREGDALETLKDIPDGIDFLLLDGWNDLYLPLVQLLERKFKTGALIYTDNASFPGTKPFLKYLADHPEKFQTVQRTSDNKGGSELSVYLGL